MNCQKCSGNRLARRGLSFMQWLLPGTALVFMPKCPFCVAGYIAVFTGVGVSVTTATWLRIGLITVCVASLVYLVASAAMNHFRTRTLHNEAHMRR